MKNEINNAAVFKALIDFSGNVYEWGTLVHKLKMSDRSSDMEGVLISDLSWQKDRLREMIEAGLPRETPFIAVEKALNDSRTLHKIQYEKLGEQGVLG